MEKTTISILAVFQKKSKQFYFIRPHQLSADNAYAPRPVKGHKVNRVKNNRLQQSNIVNWIY